MHFELLLYLLSLSSMVYVSLRERGFLHMHAPHQHAKYSYTPLSKSLAMGLYVYDDSVYLGYIHYWNSDVHLKALTYKGMDL